MNIFMCVLITTLFFIEWVTESRGWLPNEFILLPDVLAIIAAVIVLFLAARHKRLDIPARYVVVLGTAGFVLTAGIIINDVSAMTIIAAVRNYLKYLPFFFLPIVYRFTDKQLRTQLFLILTYCVVQVPVTLHQRFVRFEGRWTGDLIGGTLGENASGKLSVFLGCAVAVVAAMWVKKRISYKKMLLFAALLMVPPALNLTTVSVLLLPFAFMVPVIAGTHGPGRVRLVTMTIVLVLVAGTGFVSSYNYFRTLKGRADLIELLGSQERVTNYLYRGSDSQYEDIARGDAIVFAFRTLGRDDNLLFGVGAGNASPSPVAEMQGEYYRRYWRMQPTKVYFSKLTWETGIVGVSLYWIWMFMIWREAVRIKDEESIVGVLALSWVAITPIVAASFFYFKTFDMNLYSYLFFFYSAVIIVERCRLERAEAVN